MHMKIILEFSRDIFKEKSTNKHHLKLNNFNFRLKYYKTNNFHI